MVLPKQGCASVKFQAQIIVAKKYHNIHQTSFPAVNFDAPMSASIYGVKVFMYRKTQNSGDSSKYPLFCVFVWEVPSVTPIQINDELIKFN